MSAFLMLVKLLIIKGFFTKICCNRFVPSGIIFVVSLSLPLCTIIAHIIIVYRSLLKKTV